MKDDRIKRLPEVVKKNGFTYKLVKRTDDKLLYGQYDGSNNLIAHEIFKNKIIDNHSAANSFAKLRNIEVSLENLERWAETFPSNEEFGKRAWSITKDVQKAIERFEAME